jgi:arginine/lysine/ornithine decarboxylase
MANSYLENYSERLGEFALKVDLLKKQLLEGGYELYGDEVLKITIPTKKYGYFGYDFAKIINEKGIVCEFCDPDFVVLMLAPEIEDLSRIANIMLSIPKKEPINEPMPKFALTKKRVSIREAVMSPCETVDVEESLSRIVAMTSVGCPPAVPIVVAGEEIDENAVKCFKYYGINKVNVIK